MTQVTVSQPHGDAVLTAAALLRVTGNATGKGGFEPDVVDAVTVSFDGGPPVDASLTVVPKQKIPAVRFTADIRVPTGGLLAWRPTAAACRARCTPRSATRCGSGTGS